MGKNKYKYWRKRNALKEISNNDQNKENFVEFKKIETVTTNTATNTTTTNTITNVVPESPRETVISFNDPKNVYKEFSKDCSRPPPNYETYYTHFSFPDIEELKISIQEDSELREYLLSYLNTRRHEKFNTYKMAIGLLNEYGLPAASFPPENW